MLQQDVEFLKKRYEEDVPGKNEGRLVIRCVPPVLVRRDKLTRSKCRSEKASKTYTTEVVSNIFAEEGKDLFDSRLVSLGHTLQGGVPSPRDRTRAIRLTVKCIDFLEAHHLRKLAGQPVESFEPDIATVAVEGPGIRFVGIKEMLAASNMKDRRGKAWWWADIKDLIDMMAGRVNFEDVSFLIPTFSSNRC